MKFIFYIVTIVLFVSPSFSAVKYECNNQCVVITKGISDKPTGDLNCTLPNMPNLKIVGEDVCDVLGWMNRQV